jgi:hypothetical protein
MMHIYFPFDLGDCKWSLKTLGGMFRRMLHQAYDGVLHRSRPYSANGRSCMQFGPLSA